MIFCHCQYKLNNFFFKTLNLQNKTLIQETKKENPESDV